MKIAVASGKGGTGKTFVSTNLFYVLQERFQNTILVDFDAEEPNDMIFFNGIKQKSNPVTQKIPVIDTNSCTFCGSCYEYCSYNAIFFLPNAKFINVLEDLCHGCGACSVACKNDAITEKEKVIGHVNHYQLSQSTMVIEAKTELGVMSPVPVIKSAIKEAPQSDILILDSPPGTSCPFIQTVENADYVILVTEPTPFGLSDLIQSIETLQTLNKKFGVIINRAGLGDNKIYQYLNDNKIPILLEIPFDKNIAFYYSNGQLLVEQNNYWKNIFLNLFEKIKYYGNSSN